VRELYAYWNAPRTAAVQDELSAAMAELTQRHAGLHARLLRRADDGGGESVTWMEIYTAPGGIGAALQAEIDLALAPQLTRLGAGPRHAEVFEPTR